MTFKPETNPKETNDKKSKDVENGTTGVGTGTVESAARISTIYDPRQRCAPTSLSFVSVPVHNMTQSDIGDKKKSIVEKIKEITRKLKSKKTNDSNDMQKRSVKIVRMMCYSIWLLFETVLLMAILVFVLRSVFQKPEIKNIIVDGEFQILNKKFEYDLLDKQSPKFKELEFNLTFELNRLFRKSDVNEYFLRSEILEITANMTVKSIAIFRSSDYINVGRIGLAFLRSLKLQHGHTYLGIHTINVQSIGFQIRGEEGIWGEWSQWKGCDNPDDYVATRTRKCLTRDTFQDTNVDRCLLIPGKKSDLDIMSCNKYRDMLSKKEYDESNLNSYDTVSETDVVQPTLEKSRHNTVNIGSALL